MNNKILVIAFAWITFFNVQAQEFQGMAVYQSKTSSAEFKERMMGNREVTPEMQKRMEERMKSLFEKTFILHFDKTASIYKEEEKLETPGQNSSGGMRFMGSLMGSGGTYYKNVKQKSYTIDKEFMGKQFLVKDSLPKLQWKMEGQSRVIGGYNCFKATAVITVSEPDFNALRPKSDEEKKKAEEEAKNKKTNLLDNLIVPTEKVITAWYTPEIPVNQGPDKYWGLPGLILEINDGKTVILCSKIVLNPKEKTTIKAPTTGKVISQKEYDETVVKKTKEFMESNQRPGGGGGRGPGGSRR
ncbi:GLPGLI family protein [Flavobacterium sp. UMI-01]|uniref:GLPGLI family protein n=1 Tax=Flavobacterium sp. UMI-01 TaxID=1441053 RepID=UPI001C7DB2A3|nr:GLPGLI family protein [Flavobacterium sp. UMI-01]GIZ09205.1 GLPGLI family protein [Flavobacterium sp. UMI-01]